MLTHQKISGRNFILCMIFMLAGFFATTTAHAVWPGNNTGEALVVTITVTAAPPEIQLHWPPSALADGYIIERRAPGSTAWTTVGNAAPSSTSWTDTSVTVGTAYEYRVTHGATPGDFDGTSANKLAAIERPLLENRGKFILLVEQSIAAPLASEIKRLEQDLAGDGWVVIRHDVPRHNYAAFQTKGSASNLAWISDREMIKNLIRADYNADPANVKAVFLLGHITIPFSGWLNPDGHYWRAGPSDMYYADMHGTWTDSTVNNISTGGYSNFPNDGFFDQNGAPNGIVDLQYGRIDLADMPVFAPQSEVYLLRQYLNKDHNYRVKNFSVQNRTWVSDAGYKVLDLHTMAGGLMSIQNTVSSDPTPTFLQQMNDEDYLWGFTNLYYPSLSDFITYNQPKVVFTTMFKSYTWEWYKSNNEMKALLASSGYSLTCWYSAGFSLNRNAEFHPMGLGEPLGYCGKMGSTSAARALENTCLGDPSLRMFMISPATNLTGNKNGAQVDLSWTASTEIGVEGYFVYRSASATGPFTRLSPDLVLGTNFTDTSAPAGDATYMVRPVKLQVTHSGSYWDMGQGAFLTVGDTANTAPIAYNDTVSTGKNVAKNIGLSAMDGENNSLTYYFTKLPDHGALSGTPPNMTYTPSLNWYGTDTFSFYASDSKLNSNNATVTVNVQDINNPPTASSQSNVKVVESQSKLITLAATDLNNDPLTYSIVSPPAHGSVNLSGTSATYTPTAGYLGSDSFTFKANDGQNDSNIATIGLLVGVPAVTNVSPATADIAGGTTVTLTGTSLTGTTVVKFGNTPATSINVISSTQVTCVVPAYAVGPVSVSITTPGGTSNNGGLFNYTVGQPPTITSVSPAGGITSGGALITIIGNNLTGTSSVTIGGTAATNITVVDATQVTCVTPAHVAGLVNVTLVTPGGTVTKSGAFKYGSLPIIVSVTPNNGPSDGGTVVTLSGALAGTLGVTFGGVPATDIVVIPPTVDGPTLVTCTAPPHATGVVDISVTTVIGTSTKIGAFTYNGAPPPSTWTITATTGGNGSISPNGTVTVNNGSTQNFTITPNANYAIADVQVDGSSVGAVTSYTFTNVTADHDISATFVPITWTIATSTGNNGSISPAGTVNVGHGINKNFTITPNPGYSIADVLVDGISVGPVGNYTFSNVTANHTLSATFAQINWTITASAGTNGSITPAGIVNLTHGTSQNFTIVPNANYSIADVQVDGVSVDVLSNYTFTNITANHTINATFIPIQWSITASAGSNGSISPVGSMNVNQGSNQTYTITPNAGYAIASIQVDGVSTTIATSYTFSNVTANHSISASFLQTSGTLATITAQPSNQTRYVSQTASFSVTATGTGPLTYQWKKNGANIAGATNKNYVTPILTAADDGAIFNVIITNPAGSVASNGATLTVNVPVAPSITTQPANQSRYSNQTASFSVTATGSAPLTYQWKKNGTNIAGATNKNYVTPILTAADNGTIFNVIVSNIAGSIASNGATLTVNVPVAPSITTQPANQSRYSNQTASFSVTATGSAPLTYQWQKNGVNITEATNRNYTTPILTAADNGAIFNVIVSNIAGSITSNSAILTITLPISPSITTQPVNQTKNVGQVANFTVTATGSAPLAYQWKKNGVNIPGAQNVSYTTPALTLADNGAVFSVTVSNLAGSVTSNNATVTVN